MGVHPQQAQCVRVCLIFMGVRSSSHCAVGMGFGIAWDQENNEKEENSFVTKKTQPADNRNSHKYTVVGHAKPSK